MLRQFSREQKSDRSLDFARRNRSSLVLMSKSRRFASDSLEDVVDKGVHDAHCSAWNSNIGMNLLQNSVDETTITFLSRSLSLHHLRSSLATFASFLRTFLRRALSWALHRRWLTTSTHFESESLTWNWCQPLARKSGNETCEECGRYLWTWIGSKSRLHSNDFRRARMSRPITAQRLPAAFDSNVSFDPLFDPNSICRHFC